MRVHIAVLATAMLAGQATAGSITVIDSAPPTNPPSVQALQDTPQAPTDKTRAFSAGSRSMLTQIDPKGAVSSETVAAVPEKKKTGRQPTVMVMRGGMAGEAFPVPRPQPAAKAVKPRRASELITGRKWLSPKKPEASPPADAAPAPAAH